MGTITSITQEISRDVLPFYRMVFDRRQLIIGTAAALAVPADFWPAEDPGISHTAESIHQEPVFKAAPHRIYEALLDHKQFDKIVELSGALQAMHLGNSPVEIDRSVGGAFSIFGKHIIGRQIELVPDQRIVQAWRVVDWKPGMYSVARFELTAQSSGTKIIFDHTGFPTGLAAGLASGWQSHYWEPLEKLLT